MASPRHDGPGDASPAGAGLPAGLIELLFDNTSDGVYAIDANRRIIAWNPAAAHTLGVTAAAAVGRPCHEVLRSTVCGENCAMTYALESGEPVVNLPVDLHDAEGRRVPATLSCSVLRDRRGGVLGCVGTFRNLNWARDLLLETETAHQFAGIVSDDPHMKHIFELLPTLAQSDSSILLRGETGTGKNVVARAIHRLSARSERPLVTVNCGALPETLLESELFGVRAGAYTGAAADRQGRIAFAEGGTLFLDEIGDMSPGMQVKLLRFLQDRVYERLGDPRPVRADVRVIAATNRDLVELVAEGSFRRDLYYRINVLSVTLPPLRERARDVPLLAQRFLDRLSRCRGKRVTGLAGDAIAALAAYAWPGNVRELENVIEHAYVFSPGPLIGAEHLPDHLRSRAAGPGNAAAPTLRDYEARYLREVLERHGGNRQAAAREMGVHKTTLLRRARRLGVALPARDGRARPRRRA